MDHFNKEVSRNNRRVDLEMALTLKGYIWDLEDESKAVLVFKILSPFKILLLRFYFPFSFSYLFFSFSFFLPFYLFFGLYLKEMGCFLWFKDKNLRPS